MSSARDGKVRLPSHFQCPISLDLMTDPVTLCTGITYDRTGIEQWLIRGHNTCPVTRQVLSTQEVIPNHTLHRIIRSWCLANNISAATAASARPTTDCQDGKQPLGEIQIGELSRAALRKLRLLTKENSTCTVLARAAPVLASLLSVFSSGVDDGEIRAVRTCEEVIGTLSLLDLTDDDLSVLGDPKVLSCLGRFLSNANYQVRSKSARLLGKLVSKHPNQEAIVLTIGALPGVVEDLLQVLKDDRSHLTAPSILDTLYILCSLNQKNTLRSIKAGAVAITVDLLPETGRGICEKALSLLQILFSCAEGRAAASQHALAIPAIVKSLLRVSEGATESAVGVLRKMCRYSSDDRVRREALEAGVLGKLVVLLEVNCSPRTKQRAGELLRLLGDTRKQTSSRITGRRGLVQ